MDTQEYMILEHLRGGRSLTQYQALVKFGCFRLASRIHRLRSRGNDISSEWITVNDRRIKKYFITKKL